MIRVTFRRAYRMYQPGEDASFAADEAARLIQSGVAYDALAYANAQAKADAKAAEKAAAEAQAKADAEAAEKAAADAQAKADAEAAEKAGKAKKV